MVGQKNSEKLSNGNQPSPPPCSQFKPKHVFLPAQSLEGASCTREDYKVWPLPPRVHKLKAQFKPSEGQIDQNTSYTLAFTEEVFKKTVKVKPVGPVYAPINQDTKFEGSSTARTDYPNFKNVERTKSFMPRLLYNPAPEDRDFMSVSGMDYTKKFVPRGFATTPEAVAHAVVPASQSAEQTTPVVAL